MPKTSELFIKWLRDLTAERGEKAEFCRKTGIGRAVVDKWLSGVTAPSMETLDRIAEGTGVPVWEMLRPEGANPSPAPVAPPTPAMALEVIKAALLASGQVPAEKPIDPGTPAPISLPPRQAGTSPNLPGVVSTPPISPYSSRSCTLPTRSKPTPAYASPGITCA